VRRCKSEVERSEILEGSRAGDIYFFDKFDLISTPFGNRVVDGENWMIKSTVFRGRRREKTRGLARRLIPSDDIRSAAGLTLHHSGEGFHSTSDEL